MDTIRVHEFVSLAESSQNSIILGSDDADTVRRSKDQVDGGTSCGPSTRRYRRESS